MTPILHNADRAADAATAAGVVLGAVSLTHTVQVVQLIAGILSIIGISAGATFHIMKIIQLRRSKRDSNDQP